MDKKELKKAEQLQKEIHDIEISYWDGNISYDEMLDSEIALLLKYFQQRERETAIKFASYYIQVEKELVEPEFDEWKSNQEESNG